MARIITVVGASATEVLTSAAVIGLIRQYAGYEYIKTVTLTSTEVSGFEITGLDSSIFSSFLIVSSGLGYGGSTTNVTWTIQVLTGTNTVDSGANYEYQGIRYSSATGFTGTSQTSWTTNFGYGGPVAVADFEMRYNITPNTQTDANMTLNVTDSKQGGYWPASGVMEGIHTYAGSIATGLRISSSQNFRAITNTAYISVLGIRIKS